MAAVWKNLGVPERRKPALVSIDVILGIVHQGGHLRLPQCSAFIPEAVVFTVFLEGQSAPHGS